MTSGTPVSAGASLALCFLTRVFLESGPHFPSSSPCRRPPGPEPTCFGVTFKEKFLLSSPPPGLLRGLAPAPPGARAHRGPVGQGHGPPPPPPAPAASPAPARGPGLHLGVPPRARTPRGSSGPAVSGRPA